ncbi:MAG: hypothetical protein FWC28_00035 [Proteobacteria bacterium]|nr:hypothetical protein [Pseudomonadota bacterium]
MRCNTCVQILLGLCISCHSCPHVDKREVISEEKEGEGVVGSVFSRGELEGFLAYWEALAEGASIVKEEELREWHKLSRGRIEAIEVWAMQWAARCVMPLEVGMLPEEMRPILEAKVVCWEEAGKAGGEEAGHWLREHHRRLMGLWEAWLKRSSPPPS